MTALWIVPLLVFVAGSIGVARVLAELSRGANELRLAVLRSDDVRAATKVVRGGVEDTRGSFGTLQRR